jgi:hypothetical protein
MIQSRFEVYDSAPRNRCGGVADRPVFSHSFNVTVSILLRIALQLVNDRQLRPL